MEKTEMFAGRAEEDRESMTVDVREIGLEILLTELVRMWRRVELEAESDGRYCSGRSSSR